MYIIFIKAQHVFNLAGGNRAVGEGRNMGESDEEALMENVAVSQNGTYGCSHSAFLDRSSSIKIHQLGSSVPDVLPSYSRSPVHLS